MLGWDWAALGRINAALGAGQPLSWVGLKARRWVVTLLHPKMDDGDRDPWETSSPSALPVA